MTSGSIGLAGGSIITPSLIMLGVHPKVAGSTSMYLTLFSTLNACVLNAISGLLNYKYGLFVGGCNIVGSLIGLVLADLYVKKSGKTSLFVWLLGSVFLISLAISPYVSYQSLNQLKT